MKKIKIILILSVSFVIFIFIYGLATAFDPVYDSAKINQNIGGTLICNAVFNPDIHSSNNVISYLYKNNGTVINLGFGYYTKRQWKKNEQLIKFENWLILKTGGEFECDKLIIGNLNLPTWNEYEFTPEKVEKEKLWNIKNIKSLFGYCCSEVYIKDIKNGEIKLNYKFRVDKNQSEKYEMRTLIYLIDRKTGKPILNKVS